MRESGEITKHMTSDMKKSGKFQEGGREEGLLPEPKHWEPAFQAELLSLGNLSGQGS
jgi:hypothetical protein